MTEPFIRAFCVIDSFIAGVVNSLFELLATVIDYNFFGTDKTIGSVIEKIYVLLAIFLLFKTSVEIINFIISPDKLSSKDQGAASFVKRIIITLALLVSFPFIFDKAYELQKEVINSGLLEKLVFGTSGTNENAYGTLDSKSYGFSKLLYEDLINYQNYTKTGGMAISFAPEGCTIISDRPTNGCASIYGAPATISGYRVMTCLEEDTIGYEKVYDEQGNFLYNESITDLVCDVSLSLECRQEIMGWYERKNYDKDEDGNEIHTNGDYNETITEAILYGNNKCDEHNKALAAKHPKMDPDSFKFKDSKPEDYYPTDSYNEKYGYYIKSQIEDADYYLRKVDEAVENKSVSELLATGIFSESNSVFKYRVGMPTVLGIFAILFLAFFCIDCIYRCLRLIFFEMVAPLAIATYVDHRSATSGIFSKWVKQTVMAYIEVFFKLISLYFIIFMVVNINEIKFIGATKPLNLHENPLLMFIIMAAIIYFAWHLPKFLKQSLGIDIEGNGSYSLFKQAKQKLVKFYKNVLKVAAAVGISVATGGAAAAAGGGAAAGAAAGATTATAATTTATGTGIAAGAAGTTAAAAGTAGAAGATGGAATGATTAGASAASMAGANAVGSTAAQGVNQGAQIAKQMARSGIRAGWDAIRNPDKSLFDIVSDATEWSSKLRNLDANGIGLKDRTLNKLNKTFQLDSGNMGLYDKLANSLKEAEMKVLDIKQKIQTLDENINFFKEGSSVPTSEFDDAFEYSSSINDDGAYYMDFKYSDYESFINQNPEAVMTKEIYDEFIKLLDYKVELENEELMAEAEKEKWLELNEDLDSTS